MPNPLKIPARVESLTKHGEGIYTVNMRPLARIPRFKAGQFLHLTVDEYDPAGGFWPESRVFSIASAPGSELISIVYSVKGAYTRKMESLLEVGAPVWLKMPYGEFVIDSRVQDGQNVVLVAGGTGISPYIPYLESLLAQGCARSQVVLYYGVRFRSSVLFPQIISRCSESLRGFKAVICIESESPQGLSLPGAAFRSGRLSAEAIYDETKALGSSVFFLSGPPIMIRNFRQQFLQEGVALGNIQIDEWE